MNGMSARELMLGRLRAAAPASGSAIADMALLDQRIDAHYAAQAQYPPRSQQDLVAAMQTALSASHAEIWCADEHEWQLQLAEKIATTGVRRLLLDPAKPEGAALQQALPATVQTTAYTRPLEEWKSELFNTVDAGFTVARSGIAGTGTLIIAPDAGSPRTASLVPPLHIALVYADQLYPDLHAAAKAEHWSDGMPSNLVLVSGPSKTSDIQQTLAYGAHGPRWMWVIIVTRQAREHA